MSGLNSITSRRARHGAPGKAVSTSGPSSGPTLGQEVATTPRGSAKLTVPFPTDTDRAAPTLPTLSDDRHAAERKMLDDVLGGPRKRKERRRSHGSVTHSKGHAKASAGDVSGDLVTKMAARLGQLEKKQYMHRDEMVRKDREILKLKRRILALEAATEGKEATVSEIETLRSENLSLKSQVHDMETFLNDYGLVWVGKDSNKPASDPSPPPAGAGSGSADRKSKKAVNFSYDVDLFLERVKGLNASAGEGKKVMAKVMGAHKLVERESVQIIVYRDGIFMKRGPFRSFERSSARQVIKDILDGYFPSEFKDRYPDGVVLNVVDKSAERYDDPDSFKPFAGKGQAISDEHSNVRGLESVGGAQINLGKHEFLNNLPASVLRQGKVIPVRAEIEKMLGGKKAEAPAVVLVNTPVVQALQQDGEGGGRPITPADVATLRVKLAAGKQTLVIKLRYDDTIGDLRRAIDKHRDSTEPFVVRTTFPRKAYTDDAQTLRDAGLVPNATIMVAAE